MYHKYEDPVRSEDDNERYFNALFHNPVFLSKAEAFFTQNPRQSFGINVASNLDGHKLLKTRSNDMADESENSIYRSKLSQILTKNQVYWTKDLVGIKSPRKTAFPSNLLKVIVEVSYKEDIENINQLTEEGIVGIYYNLHNGFLASFEAFVKRLDTEQRAYEQFIRWNLAIAMVQLSPRTPKVGSFKGDRRIKVVNNGEELLIGCNRFNLSPKIHSLVYVNCKQALSVIKKNDLIEIGEQVRLTVMEIIDDSFIRCKVISDGLMAVGLDVKISSYQPILKETSLEEIEDLEFATKNKISIVLMRDYDNPEFYEPIFNILKQNNDTHVRLFAVVTKLKNLNHEVTESLMKRFDGVALCLSEIVKNQDPKTFGILKLMVDLCFEVAKPLVFLSEAHLLYCSGFFKMKFPKIIDYWLNRLHLNDKSDTLMQGPSHASSDSDSFFLLPALANLCREIECKAVVVPSDNGIFPIKLAFAIPHCPILTLLKNKYASNYIELAPNIIPYVLLREKQPISEATEINKENDRNLYQTVSIGLTILVGKKLIKPGDSIVYCYKTQPNLNRPDEIMVFTVSNRMFEFFKSHI